MNILITGSRGFIGSHLGNRLVELGHNVTGVDSGLNLSDNKTNFFSGELNFQDIDPEDLKKTDVVVHLAASINVDESIKEPRQYFENNARGTFLLLEKIRLFNPGLKFIYASSAEVYGSARYPKMTEDHPLDPLSPYAVSKLSAEQFCKTYGQLYGIDVTVVRNFNTFGEYQRGGVYGGVIAKFASLAKKGESPIVYGSGEQMRDYMYIKQAVDGYVLAIERKLPSIINFGSGVPIRIVDIANFIGTYFGVSVEHSAARPNEIMRLEADVTRATLYGYRIQTDFWKDLEKYLEFVKNNG